jgi:hypothetical protein
MRRPAFLTECKVNLFSALHKSQDYYAVLCTIVVMLPLDPLTGCGKINLLSSLVSEWSKKGFLPVGKVFDLADSHQTLWRPFPKTVKENGRKGIIASGKLLSNFGFFGILIHDLSTLCVFLLGIGFLFLGRFNSCNYIQRRIKPITFPLSHFGYDVCFDKLSYQFCG